MNTDLAEESSGRAFLAEFWRCPKHALDFSDEHSVAKRSAHLWFGKNTLPSTRLRPSGACVLYRALYLG